MSAEVWKPAVGYEGIYEVSSHGRIRRVAPGRGTHPGRMLNPLTDDKGYLYVNLSGRMRRIHRLVLAAFVGESDMLCRHLDGDPKNNTLSNLRYGTPKENSADRITHGRHRLNGRLDRTHCRRGHEYTPENTMIAREKNKRPYRKCRECHRVMRLNSRHRKREQASQG